jgi:hypothetical protein
MINHYQRARCPRYRDENNEWKPHECAARIGDDLGHGWKFQGYLRLWITLLNVEELPAERLDGQAGNTAHDNLENRVTKVNASSVRVPLWIEDTYSHITISVPRSPPNFSPIIWHNDSNER